MAIDGVRFSKPGSLSQNAALGTLVRLLEENPESATRAHVLHNLGTGRRAWLRQYATTLPVKSAALVGGLT